MTALDQSPTEPPSSTWNEPSTATQLSFSPSLRPVLVFFLVSTLAVPVLFLLADPRLPRTPFWSRLFTATAITSVAVFAWGVLRWEGVSAADIGLDRERVVSGVVLEPVREFHQTNWPTSDLIGNESWMNQPTGILLLP